jgi:hypothetical protein
MSCSTSLLGGGNRAKGWENKLNDRHPKLVEREKKPRRQD